MTILQLSKKGKEKAIGEVGYNSKEWIEEGKEEKRGQSGSEWDPEAGPRVDQPYEC